MSSVMVPARTCFCLCSKLEANVHQQYICTIPAVPAASVMLTCVSDLGRGAV